MAQLTYYPPPDGPAPAANRLPPRPPTRDQVEIRHGYTMADLDQIARMAMARGYGHMMIDHYDRYQGAWDGAVDLLLTSPIPPDRQDLVAAAARHLSREWKSYRRLHGLTDEGGIGPRFIAYWAEPPEPAAERLMEAMTLKVVWDPLSTTHRDTLAALAAAGDRQRAAACSGVSRHAFTQRLRKARRAALIAWFDHEAAPLRLLADRGRQVGSYDSPLATHCHRGHEFTPENTNWYQSRPGGAKVRRCLACVRLRYHENKAASR
jgi:hypothetical protein